MHIDECLVENLTDSGIHYTSLELQKLKEYLILQNDRILLLEDAVKKMGAENAHYQRALKEIGL